MPLKRVWTPTGNYSSGGNKRILVVHTMEGFTGPNGAYDCAHYFQGNVGASSHVCIDNNRGTVWEGVSRNNSSWTQCNYNGDTAASVEQSGYASWSRQYWIDNRDAQLWNIADWLREESQHFGIPLVLLNDSQSQGSGRGVTFHSRLGSYGCGHADPGNGWPWDIVLERAKGTTQPTPPSETEDEMIPVIIPPGNSPEESPDIGIAFTGGGKYNHFEVVADIGRVNAPECRVRVALHFSDEGWGGVTTMVMKPNNTKVVMSFGANVDGMSIRREDDYPITLYGSIDKY